MWYYLPIVFIPAFLVIVASKFFFPHHVTWKEWAVQLGAGVILTVILTAATMIGGSMGSADFTIFSGQVTGKESVRVSCSHQYKCGETCRTESYTDSKGKRHSRRVCDPVYCDEHDYDVSWRVYTTLGTWTIDRVDRRGLKMPPRWDDTYINEPVAESRFASNYLLLNDDRFGTSSSVRAKFAGHLFAYPVPYDYWKIQRVLQDNGRDYDSISIWLNEQLKKDGPAKQLNVILVVTKNLDPELYFAQIEAWRGVRKNDVVLFYGVDEDENVKWAKAMSFADGQDNLVMLKELQSMTYERTFGVELVQEQYKKIVAEFHRVPNSTFEYMKDAWVPPTWWIITMSIVNLLAAIGIAWFMVKEDLFR
ncbi:hypothetical protein D3C81_376550 [compost metagenome]